jgi:magnesium-transporting ATPase (P-type)
VRKKEKLQDFIEKYLNKLESLWVSYSFLICFSFALITGVLYYTGLIVNFRGMTMNVVNFASIVIGVSGVFLTLIITLKESPVFERLSAFYPTIQKDLYIYLRNQIYFSLVVVILSVIINILPPAPHELLSTLGVLIWFLFFWLMSFGTFYAVKLIIDLVIKNFEVPERKSRR